jgi:GntR family transcriptional regulator
MTRKHRSRAGGTAGSMFTSAEVPLYYQLAGVLREQILSGRFGTGDRIPTEVELVKSYGVSRITVRQALASLEKEGLVRREVGRGTFVNEQRPFTGELKVEGSLDDLISIGMFTSVKLLGVRTVKATPDEAAMLKLEPGAPITRCARLRYWHGDPYCHIVVDLPQAIGKRLSRADFKGSILRALEDKLDIHIRDAQQTVRASLADASLARLLETRIGAPLLSINRIVLRDDGTPVERVRTHYRSDIYCFSVHLARDRDQRRWSARAKRPPVTPAPAAARRKAP